MTKTEKVKNYLLRLIEESKNQSDFKLPSQNALSRILQVSRITVLNALTELSASGRIVGIKGKGNFAVPQNKSGDSAREIKMTALILPDLKSVFMLRLIKHTEKFLRQKGYSLAVYCSENQRQKEYDRIALARACGAKGIIIYPNNSSQINKTLFNKALGETPAVFIDAHCKRTGHVSIFSSSVIDVSFIIGYLHRLGHSNIGCIMTDPAENEIMNDRFNGYKKGMRGSAVAVHKKNLLILSNTPDSGTEDKIREYFKNNPRMTAVITLNSRLYSQTVYVLRSMKKRIPQDISVTSYNDDFFHERLISPVPTVINQRLDVIMQTACKKILMMIGGEKLAPCDIEIASEHLIADTTRSLHAE